MGMYDQVRAPKTKCPSCEKEIAASAIWQSKDDECILNVVPFWKVQRFYTSCPHCEKWVEFNRKMLDPQFEEDVLKKYYEVTNSYD